MIKNNIEELEKELERAIYFAQALTNNYDKVNKLRRELRILKENECLEV